MKIVSRGLCLCLVIGFAFSSGLYAADANMAGIGSGKKIDFNFRDANIRTVINFMAKFDDLVVVMDKKIKGKITVATPKKVTVGEAFKVLMAMLDLQGLTVQRTERFLKVMKKKDAVQRPVDIFFGADIKNVPDEDRVITYIIPLKYAKSSSILGNVRALVSKTGNAFENGDANYIIITDVGTNIRRILKIASYLDVDADDWGERVVYSIKHMQAKDMMAALEKLFKSKKTKTSERIQFTSIEKINALVVTAEAATHEKIKKMISRIDSPTVTTERTVVYPIRYMNAKEMGDALEKVFAGDKAKGGRAGIKITPVESVNSLVVTASMDMHRNLEKTIMSLDVRRRQVLIEAKIVEVTLSEGLEFGLDLAKYLSGPGGSVSILDIGKSVSDPFLAFSISSVNLNASLKALAEKSDLKILSSPRILTSDNQTAKIAVGKEQPILKSVTDLGPEGSGKTVSDYVYKDVGIELEVTPRINVDRDVSLEVHFKITSILSEKIFPGGVTAPVVGKREATTTVNIMDGKTLVIGGLMKEDTRDERQKVPILGDIPLLGLLFSHVKKVKETTELLVFITPHVIVNVEEGTAVTESEQKKMGIVLKKVDKISKESEEKE